MIMEYDEATAIRRATRLVQNSNGLDFSLLNTMFIILILAVVIAGFASILG